MSMRRVRPESGDLGKRADGVGADDDSLVVSILEAIREQQDGTELQPVQLYDHVDPEVLDQLLAHSGTRPASEWELCFAVEDVTVTVTSDGEVSAR